MRFYTTFCCLFLTLITLAPAASRAQDSPELNPAVRAYLEKTTVVLAHADLTKVDVPRAVDWFNKQSGGAAQEPATTVKVVGATVVRSLVDAGLAHAYATVSTLDVARGGAVLLLPCRDTDAVKLLAETVIAQSPKQLDYKVFAVDSLVVVAQPGTWARIALKPDAGSKPLVQALQAGMSHAVSAAFHFPDSLRNEVAAIWPNKLPSDMPLELSPKQLMGDVESLTLLLDLPPSPSFSALVRGASDDGRTRTQQVLERLAAQLKQPAGDVAVTKDQEGLKLTIGEPLLIASLLQITGPARTLAAESQSSNNLKQIMLAMHNYHDNYEFFPPRETRSKADAPLLSWRVHILPYIGEQALYEKFHLDEPWDSPHNAKLIPQMPQTYAVRGDDLAPGKTRYVLPMLEGGAWYGDGPPITIKQITDGTSNTVAVVIGPKDKAVTWTKPEELPLTADNITSQLFADREAILTGFFDGSVRSLQRSNGDKIIHDVITMAGGEVYKLLE